MDSGMIFCTIVFNNPVEINLLKLQASSFIKVDKNIIDKIYVFYNDNENTLSAFKEMFDKEIIDLYPNYLKHLIHVISLSDIDATDLIPSTWFTQQIVKIIISKIISTKYYVVLDSKNHFINNVNKEYFFQDNKPILYYNKIGDKMKSFYDNCFSYFQEFQTDNGCLMNKYSELRHNERNYNNNLLIQTITPFLFITDQCLNLIREIEAKENICFKDFIKKERKYTEFYLYYSYLCCFDLDKLYFYKSDMIPVLTIGNKGPDKHSAIQHKLRKLQKFNIKVISLHRKSFTTFDDNYKLNLFDLYTKYNDDINTLSLIKNMLNIN